MNAFQLLVSPHGRVNRTVFWLGMIPLILTIAYAWILSQSDEYRLATLGPVIGISVVWPILAVTVKRWHDRGKSGWWVLILAVPIVGQLWTFVECGLLEGNKDPNRFGTPVKKILDPSNTAGRSKATRKQSKDPSENGRPIAADLTSLMKMAGLVIRVDRENLGGKYEHLRRYLRDMVELEPDFLRTAMDSAKGARFSNDSVSDFAARFKEFHGGDSEVMNVAADLLFELAMGDGSLSAAEEVLLVQVHDVFGFPGSSYSAFKHSRSGGGEHQREGGQQKRSTGGTPSDDRRYGEILGLKGKITKAEIRKAYRELVKQYHPDRVATLGPRLREAAHQEMKEINEAYDYFRRKYGL